MTVLRGLAALAALIITLPQAAMADGGADFIRAMQPYAGAGLDYDSNLFRLSDDQLATDTYGKKTPSDSIYRIYAGFDGQLDISKQNIVLQGDVSRNLYDTYDELDFTGANAAVLWNWEAGEQWGGELGYTFERDRQDFDNQSIVRREELPPGSGMLVSCEDSVLVPCQKKLADIRERHQIKGIASYWVTRDWKVFARGKYTDVSFDNKKQLDIERTTIGGGADYINKIGNRIGVDADFISGRYKQNVNTGQSDYDEYNFGPTLNWKVSGKTRVRGRVRYTDRNFDDPMQDDFGGVTWRLTLVRNPEEATNLEAAFYREISTLNDAISNYAVIDGFSVAPVWELSGKTSLQLLGQYEQRDFKGSGEINVGMVGPQRKDKVATAQASINWELSRVLSLAAAYTYEDRSSNKSIEEYDFNRIELKIQGGF